MRIVFFAVAVLASWLGTAAALALARSRRLIDRDEARGLVPYRRIPRIGGLGIAIGFALVTLLERAVGLPGMGGAATWAAASTLFTVGFVDDLRPVPAQIKLAVLLGVGALLGACGEGVRALPLVGELGPLASAAASAIWFGAVGTAWNFVDGLDGLAAGLTCIAASAFALAGGGAHAAALAGAAFGFLAHNRHPSRIFMGDGGSFFLGFWVAWLALRTGTTGLPPTALLAAIAWPSADLAWAMLGRLHRRGLFRAGSEHLHYLLSARIGHAATVLVALAAAGAAGVAAVAAQAGVASAALMLVAMVGLWLFTARVRRTRLALAMAAGLALRLEAAARAGDSRAAHRPAISASVEHRTVARAAPARRPPGEAAMGLDWPNR